MAEGATSLNPTQVATLDWVTEHNLWADVASLQQLSELTLTSLKKDLQVSLRDTVETQLSSWKVILREELLADGQAAYAKMEERVVLLEKEVTGLAKLPERVDALKKDVTNLAVSVTQNFAEATARNRKVEAGIEALLERVPPHPGLEEAHVSKQGWQKYYVVHFIHFLHVKAPIG